MEQSLQVLSKQERLAEWSERIMKYRNSGMTVRRWCQENGIAEKSYFYWQRRLFETLSRKQEAAVPTFAEVTLLRSVHSGKVNIPTLRSRVSGV